MPLRTVKVPPAMEPLFERAEEYVAGYFQRTAMEPERGTITIGGERYILMRASSMSVHFLEFVEALYPGLDEDGAAGAAASILFDIAHAIGKADARAFHREMGVNDPIAMLSSGPVHFAYTGWAFVDIHPESQPTPDVGFYLVYDHPYSFEAEAWRKSAKDPGRSVCHMSAGYSSGWCTESFSVELTAREILCQGAGDAHCRFIMSHASRLELHIDAYADAHPDLALRGHRPTPPRTP